MNSKRQTMEEFRRLIEKGTVQRAYRLILSYMLGLRSYFQHRLGDSAVSDLYQGAMDITFFALFPPSLRTRNLKIAVVFNYEPFRFEAWLSGRNRSVQRHYRELLKDREWPGYRVTAPAKGVDSILECDLATNFDLDDPDSLTAIIEARTRAFLGDIEQALAEGRPLESSRPPADSSRAGRKR